jgi:hypothetical protein
MLEWLTSHHVVMKKKAGTMSDDKAQLAGNRSTFQDEKERQQFLDLCIGLTLLGEVGRRQYFEYLQTQQAQFERQLKQRAS